MREPPVQFFDWKSSHRLILSRYSEGGSILAELTRNPTELEQLAFLDSATSGRIEGEQHGLPGISPLELVYGIPNAHIVRAAYTYPGEFGSRFSDNTRGAWYAADQQATSIAEVCYHKAKQLADIIVPGAPGERPQHDVVTYDDWLADFNAEFHVLEPATAFADVLQPEPVPQCYAQSQEFARSLLEKRSNGLVYPSVRRQASQCIACFRPALVSNPRISARLEITFNGIASGYQYGVRPVPSV